MFRRNSEQVIEVDPANGTEVVFVEEQLQPDAMSFFSDEEFQRHVSVILEAIKADREKELRCIAEIHAYLSLMDKGFRQMFADMAKIGGPIGMMRAMFGRGH